jgi:hypothetical protein
VKDGIRRLSQLRKDANSITRPKSAFSRSGGDFSPDKKEVKFSPQIMNVLGKDCANNFD